MKHGVFGTAAVAAFALTALLPFPAHALEGDAAALLAKHHAYVGWSLGDGTFKTLRQTGTVSEGGKVLGTLTKLWYGVAYRVTTANAANATSRDSGFTGSVFWTSNSNGFTVRPVGEVVRILADFEAFYGELTPTFPAAISKNEPIDGATTTKIRLTPTIGAPMDVWIDPATGAYKRVVIDPDGKYETDLTHLEYTDVGGGKRVLSSYRFGQSGATYRYDTIEPNAKFEAEALHPPRQSATWTFADQPAQVELTQNTFPRIELDVIVNGVKGHFILDTGAAGTLLTDDFARRSGAKKVGATVISGIGGSAAGTVVRLDTIGVGGSTLHDVIASSGMRKFGDYDGLLGFDLLGGAIVDLDLDAKTLRVMDPAKVEPNQSKGFVIHADLSTQHIRVPMKLNGRYDVVATLDSGNPLNVLFSTDLIFRDHMPFLVDPQTLGSTREGGGIAGSEVEHCGKLAELALGPIVYRPVPACDSPSFSRNEILVGLDFMKAFNYVFDYPDGIIVMIPRK